LYETSNIDALRQQCIQFTQAYASGWVCSPSQASNVTGKHPARVGITDWIPGNDPKDKKLLGLDDFDVLPPGELTLAETFKAHGYKTFFAGKWHLGGNGFLLENQGFDINIGRLGADSPPGGYYTPYKNPKLTDGKDGEYLTGRLADESIHFPDTIRQDPFFLFLAFFTVHTPIQPNNLYIEKFEKKLAGMENGATTYRDEGSGVLNVVGEEHQQRRKNTNNGGRTPATAGQRIQAQEKTDVMKENKHIERDAQTTTKIFDDRSLKVDYRTLEPILKKGRTVLGAGCGTGSISKDMAKIVGDSGKVIATDNTLKFIERGKETYKNITNLTLIHSDLFHFEPHERFDLITSARTLQWLNNPKDALLKMKSLLKCEWWNFDPGL
jgi:hypothetical protein